jgi:hypothetical protein
MAVACVRSPSSSTTLLGLPSRRISGCFSGRGTGRLGQRSWRHTRAEDRPDGRTVALTFDDGLESLVSGVVPLLQRYGFRGIAFVVAGLVPERSGGWACRLGGAPGRRGSGRRRGRFPIDAGFTANVPIPRLRNEVPVVGTPIYRGCPRYTADRGFSPDPEALERCRSFVRERGEERQTQRWRRICVPRSNGSPPSVPTPLSASSASRGMHGRRGRTDWQGGRIVADRRLSSVPPRFRPRRSAIVAAPLCGLATAIAGSGAEGLGARPEGARTSVPGGGHGLSSGAG